MIDYIVPRMYDDLAQQILTALTRLERGQAALEKGQAALEKGQAALAGDFVRLRSEVMARIDRLQDTVNLMHDDIGVNFGRADQVERKGDHTRDELRDLAKLVSGMQHQIHRLQGEVMQIRGGDPDPHSPPL